MQLQINTSGAWRNVCEFPAFQRALAIASVGALGGIVDAKWCLLHDNGKREWLSADRTADWAHWRPVTADAPAPLDDVMITVRDPVDGSRVTYMGYRKADGSNVFCLSGGDGVDLFRHVVAWAPCMPAAPASMGRDAA